MHIQFRTILSLALASLMIANPAFAQSIDLSPVQNLLQGIVDTITGPLGIVIGTLRDFTAFLCGPATGSDQAVLSFRQRAQQ